MHSCSRSHKCWGCSGGSSICPKVTVATAGLDGVGGTEYSALASSCPRWKQFPRCPQPVGLQRSRSSSLSYLCLKPNSLLPKLCSLYNGICPPPPNKFSVLFTFYIKKGRHKERNILLIPALVVQTHQSMPSPSGNQIMADIILPTSLSNCGINICFHGDISSSPFARQT